MDDKKAKIKSLMSKATDPAATAAEAATAMDMARKLMERHGITEADLDTATSADFKDSEFAGRETKYGTVYHPVDKHLCGMIAAFCGTRAIFFTKGFMSGDPKLLYVGLEADVEYSEWLRGAFVKAYDDGWNALSITLGLRAIKGARQSYTRGFVETMNARLQDWIYRARDEHDGVTMNALVVKKYDVVQAELDRRGWHTSKKATAALGGKNANAVGAGRNAAAGMQMGRGVGTGGVKQIGVSR